MYTQSTLGSSSCTRTHWYGSYCTTHISNKMAVTICTYLYLCNEYYRFDPSVKDIKQWRIKEYNLSVRLLISIVVTSQKANPDLLQFDDQMVTSKTYICICKCMCSKCKSSYILSTEYILDNT